MSKTIKGKQKYKSASVGYSLTRTTCDNGCGPHEDKRLKRLKTRNARKLDWKREYE